MEIFWSEKLKVPDERKFQVFYQGMANRIMQGHARYGPPNRRKRYMTRLIAEIEAYQKTGNAEHLLNAANYCNLEWIEPENPKFHFDPTIDSVTRR